MIKNNRKSGTNAIKLSFNESRNMEEKKNATRPVQCRPAAFLVEGCEPRGFGAFLELAPARLSLIAD